MLFRRLLCLFNTLLNKSFNKPTSHLSLLILLSPCVSIAQTLTLQQAENIALLDEPGLLSQNWQSHSLIEQSIADAQLRDPKIQIALNNLSLDSFDFNAEPMTQLKLSYMQQFPSGDTLILKQQKTQQMSQLVRTNMAERELMILKKVRLAYLDIFYWEYAKSTILKNKTLFIQLVDIVQSLFSVGRSNQQDLIRSQLELSRLDDKLAKIEQQIYTQRSQLSQWIGVENSQRSLGDTIPTLPIARLADDSEGLSQYFLQHPVIQQIDQQIKINRKDIQIVDESLNSGWTLNLSYAYRASAPNGDDRPDFISAAATFDLPFFTEKRQDKKRLSKEYFYQSLKNKRLQTLKKLVAEVQKEMVNQTILNKRQRLYGNLLLPQAKQQSEASLLAYQSDRGTFSDVIRAYMDDLNANLDAKRIAIDSKKSQAKILYYVFSNVQNAK